MHAAEVKAKLKKVKYPCRRRECMQRKWSYNSTHSSSRHWMQVIGQFYVPALLYPGNKPRYAWARRLVGPRTDLDISKKRKIHAKNIQTALGPTSWSYKYDFEFTVVLIVDVSSRSNHCHLLTSIGGLFLDDGRLNASLGDAKRKRQMTVFN